MRTCLDHCLDSLARRGMNEINGGAGRLRPLYGRGESELLGELIVHEVKVRTMGASLFAKALVIELDDVVILGMDDHQTAVTSRVIHREFDASEIEFER